MMVVEVYWYEKGLSLLRREIRSGQVKKVFSEDKELFFCSKHSSMINGLQGCYPIYGPVVRYGKWSEEDTAVLVPGDIVRIKLGNIIPADAHLLEGDPLKIDQNHFLLPNIPVMGFTQAQPASKVRSKQLLSQLEFTLFFGKAAHLVENTTHVGHFQQVGF